MTYARILLDFLAEHLADVETGWSIGTFGAIAASRGMPKRARHCIVAAVQFRR